MHEDIQEGMHEDIYDVIIVGAGPAGLTAALYLARARYRVLVVEKERVGGQITITADVVNYPGVLRASGSALTETMRQQAVGFGAEFLAAEVTGLALDGSIKQVQTSRGSRQAFGVLLATGAKPRSLGFVGEEEFKGHGVAYCATCDGEFFTGLEVFVIGGGFAAAEEAIFLTSYARKVTIVLRGKDFSCAQSIADAVKAHPKIEIRYQTVLEEVSGDSALRCARFKDNQTGETWEHRPAEGETFGVFVFAGYTPETALVKGLVDLDDAGYVLTDANRASSQEGVYAAGDVCVKRLRQVVTATADGAIAATELEHYAQKQREQTGITPKLPAAQTVGAAGAGHTGAAVPAAAAGHAAAAAPAAENDSDGLFSPDIRSQLATLFERMEDPLQLRLSLDDRPVSTELEQYASELAALTDKLSVEKSDSPESAAPCVRLFKDGADTGLAFHGVPGGHEFNSFALGLYNAAGPGQQLDDQIRASIAAIDQETEIKLLVSLSCTMCPDAVVAAQHIAALNPKIRAEVYDIAHFEEIKQQYQVMSVPCVVVSQNGQETVNFGRKDINQLLEML